MVVMTMMKTVLISASACDAGDDDDGDDDDNDDGDCYEIFKN